MAQYKKGEGSLDNGLFENLDNETPNNSKKILKIGKKTFYIYSSTYNQL
jgi:hypothetical protein